MEPLSQKKLIKDLSIQPRKSLGQHFVVNNEILDKIVELSNLNPDDLVVEIGAGLGGLTTRISEHVKQVLAIEKDWKLANLLRNKIIKQKNVKIIHQDARYFDYELAAKESGQRMKLIGNLPFNIASPLTIELLKKGMVIESMVFMYQKEVAERITAQTGTKDYGFLTIVTNLYADTQEILSVGKDAFYPTPKVESKVVQFNLLSSPRELLENEKFFFKVVKSAFSQRRKKLRNSLKSIGGVPLSSEAVEKICRETCIDPEQRAESLSLKEFARLANYCFFIER